MALQNAPRDPLTGLLSRAVLKPQVEHAIEHSAGSAEFALVVLDLDHFKSINDAFGHQRGDRILEEFAQRAVELSRARDTLFRYGGDEFVALLPDSGRVQALAFAWRLLDQMRAIPFAGQPALTIALSAGVAAYPSDGQTFDELFAAADRRHYLAKYLGRAQVIGDDDPLPSGAPIEAPSRLIERDQAMAAIHQFLDEQATATRSLMHVRGERGAGHTRLLAETRQAAAMRGIGVLSLHGSPALHGRVAGSLIEMLHGLPVEVAATYDAAILAAALQYWLDHEGLDGLVLTVDNLHYLDETTLDTLRGLVEHPQLERLALVIAENDTLAFNLRAVSFETEVRLTALSAQGIRTWLRHSLRWEPPADTIEWLRNATHGLPAPLWRGLRRLLSSNSLVRAASGWRLTAPYAEIPLVEWCDARSSLPPNNLPTLLSRFVGRAGDLRQLHDLLVHRRIVGVVGHGGLGKTRLALQVGAEQLERFPDGVFFVNLADAPSDTWVLSRIADVVGIGNSGTAPAAALAALRGRTLLLILDNVEEIAGLATIVELLLQHGDSLTILLTSRERPALSECAILELGGLDLPHSNAPETALHSAAVQLFIQRARRIQHTFDPDEHERAAITRICRLLDGMPLGIELAAGWVAGASVQQIARLISDNLRALVADEPDLPDRHRRIFAVIDAFWERLAPAERAMLRPLGLFRGGFEAEAARVVGQVSPFFLSSLVTSGYLRRTPSGRYEMHELLRLYALRQLHPAPRVRRAAEERHARHYAERVRQSAATLLAGGEHLAPFRADIENILAAWEWAVRRTRIDLLHALGPGLARYWELIGKTYVGEPTLWSAIEQLRKRVRSLEPQDIALLSHLLCRVAWYQLLHQSQISNALLDEAALYASTSEFDDAVVEATLMRCWQLGLQSPAAARAALEQALALRGSPSLAAECLRQLGILYQQTFQLALAAEYLERALQQFTACGDRLGEMRSSANLIYLDIDRLAYAAADRRAQRLLAQARAIGSVEMQCVALTQLCLSALHRAALERAESYLQRARSIARVNGDQPLELICLELECILADLSNAPPLAELWSEALERFERNGDNPGLATVWTLLGHSYRMLGDLAAAQHAYSAAEQALLASGARYALIQRAGQAAILYAGGQITAALAQIDELLQARAQQPLELLREPFVVFDMLCPILASAGDARASQLRQEAHALLAQRLAAIEDAGERVRYEATMRARWAVLQ
jgi:diguanylate cyclase (GGDEF)-like protein